MKTTKRENVIFITFAVFFMQITREKAIFSEEIAANAFVTFHLLNSAQLISAIDQIQGEFLQKDWRFRHTFQPLNSLHVSLLFVHLKEQNFQNGTDALLKAIERFHFIYGGSKLRVHFQGIAHNGNASVYAALDPKGTNVQRVTKLHELLAEEFSDREIPPLNPFHEKFHLHSTILALSQPSDLELIKYWPEEEQKWRGRVLGKEKVKLLQICNMTMDEKTKDYEILFEAPI